MVSEGRPMMISQNRGDMNTQLSSRSSSKPVVRMTTSAATRSPPSSTTPSALKPKVSDLLSTMPPSATMS
jgi:hypothetical protein